MYVCIRRTGRQRISVCVRKRPLARAEGRRGEADVVTTPGGDCVVVHESKEAVDLTEYILQVKRGNKNSKAREKLCQTQVFDLVLFISSKPPDCWCCFTAQVLL